MGSPLRSWITRNLYLPLSARLQGERMGRCLRELEASQWWSPRALREAQWRALEGTLEEARRAIPLYRETWGELGRRGVRSWEEFQALPILEKEQVRERFDSLHRPETGESLGETSGSTGRALRFVHGRLFRSRHEAGQWRARGWFGVRPGDGMFAVWGRPVGDRRAWAWLQLKSALNHILHVSAFELDPVTLQALPDRVRRFRPRLVYGYPSGLYEVARQAERAGIRLDGVGVALVGSTAEVLHEFQREGLARVFGAPVADVYGCGEFGAFAHQCPQGSMHVSCENVVVEVLQGDRPAPPGEVGEVVVTGLHNPAMPLIRYRVGDLAVAGGEPCPCGRGLPTLGVKAGKAGQMVRTSGGRLFSTELFDYVNKRLITAGLGGVEGFHVVQSELDRFTVRYVAGEGDQGRALAVFEQGMREVVGPTARLEFLEVPEIPRHPGGKLGYFSCEMEPGAPRIGSGPDGA